MQRTYYQVFGPIYWYTLGVSRQRHELSSRYRTRRFCFKTRVHFIRYVIYHRVHLFTQLQFFKRLSTNYLCIVLFCVVDLSIVMVRKHGLKSLKCYGTKVKYYSCFCLHIFSVFT